MQFHNTLIWQTTSQEQQPLPLIVKNKQKNIKTFTDLSKNDNNENTVIIPKYATLMFNT